MSVPAGRLARLQPEVAPAVYEHTVVPFTEMVIVPAVTGAPPAVTVAGLVADQLDKTTEGTDRDVAVAEKQDGDEGRFALFTLSGTSTWLLVRAP